MATYVYVRRGDRYARATTDPWYRPCSAVLLCSTWYSFGKLTGSA